MRKEDLLYINGKDAWTTWSAMLAEDSYDNLLLPAGPKAYVENDSRSQSGKQVFFDNPQFMDRNIQLMFEISCESRIDYRIKYHSLIDEMRKGLIELKVMPLTTIYKVYLPENCFLSLSTDNNISMGKLSVRVTEPNPSDRESTLKTAYILSSENKPLINESNRILTRNIK
jgi:hypothetical protein